MHRYWGRRRTWLLVGREREPGGAQKGMGDAGPDRLGGSLNGRPESRLWGALRAHLRLDGTWRRCPKAPADAHLTGNGLTG